MILKNKKSLSILLALTLLFSMTIAVNAQTNLTSASSQSPGGTIQPYWAQTSTITIGLSFSGSKGTLSYSVLGNSGTTRIDGVAVLERLNSNGTYTEITRWTGITINSDYLPWNATYYVSTGYTYRFTFTCTVYRNGTTETIPMSYSNTAY